MSDSEIVRCADERLVLGNILKVFVVRLVKAVIIRWDSHEEKIIPVSKPDIIRWHSEHSARVPHKLPVLFALRLRTVPYAGQNAVHSVAQEALVEHQKWNAKKQFEVKN